MLKKLFAFLVVAASYVPAFSQTYTVKTIFQYWGIENKKRPLSDPAVFVQDRKNLYDEEMKVAEDVGYARPSSWSATASGLGEWLKKNPPGKMPLPPERVRFIGSNRSRATELEFRDGHYAVAVNDRPVATVKALFVQHPEYAKPGFSAYDTGYYCRYFTAEGQLLLDRKFQYVEGDGSGYFVFYQGKRCGVADSSGKVLLPAEYDVVTPFRFRGGPWFSVEKEGKAWYVKPGSDKPVLPNFTGNAHILPDIVADRYWVAEGRVFDLVKGEELFVGLKEAIHAGSDDHPVFYIRLKLEYKATANDRKRDRSRDRLDEECRLYFDAEGKLLCGEPLRQIGHIGDSLVLASVFWKDTIVNDMGFTLHKYGLLNTRFQWLRPARYDIMRELYGQEAVLFVDRSAGKNLPGLIDRYGKVIIPEGRYSFFGRGGKEDRYTCYREGRSVLWNARTGDSIELERNFVEIRERDANRPLHFFFGVAPRNRHYLLDTNYRLVDTTAWADIDVAWSSGLITCYPFVNGERDYYGEHFFFDREHQRMTVAYKDSIYKAFTEIDSIGPGRMLFRLRSGRHLVRNADGFVWEFSHDKLKYDPFFNWYIAANRQGQYGLLDEKGRELLPFQYGKIEGYSPRYGTMTLHTGPDKKLQMDERGRLLFDGMYENTEPVTRDLFIVASGNKKGLLRREGREVLPVKYYTLEVKYGMVWYGMIGEEVKGVAVGEMLK